jgi:hypothetical protein
MMKGPSSFDRLLTVVVKEHCGTVLSPEELSDILSSNFYETAYTVTMSEIVVMLFQGNCIEKNEVLANEYLQHILIEDVGLTYSFAVSEARKAAVISGELNLSYEEFKLQNGPWLGDTISEEGLLNIMFKRYPENYAFSEKTIEIARWIAKSLRSNRQGMMKAATDIRNDKFNVRNPKEMS